MGDVDAIVTSPLFHDLLQLLQWVIYGGVLLLLFSLRAGIKGGQWLSSGESLKERVDRAGKKMSDLATHIQALPMRLQADNDKRYQSLALSEERWKVRQREYDALERRVTDLERHLGRG